jgi:hypothetical protein
MRFLAGLVVGIVIGRPILNVANEHLTPPVRRRIIKSVTGLADRVNAWVDRQEPEAEG